MPGPVFIFGPGVRLWHWLNSLIIVVLCLTGYYIGVPPPSVLGDTSTLYVMGWIRFFHLASGYLLAILCIMRVWLVFVEKGISHQLFLPAFWRAEWMDGFIQQVKWNFMMLPNPTRYVGLNPLAGVSMLFLFVLPCFIEILTGFAMYAEVSGHDSWQYHCFGWVTLFFGNTMDLHIIHRLSMWVITVFTFVHVYIAVREDILSRQTMISTMLSGIRQYRR